MNTIKKVLRGIVAFFILYVLIGAFGSKIHSALVENHIYSEWWFWLLLVVGALFTYAWITQDSPASSTSVPKKKGRDYSRESKDCDRAWQLIRKNGWNADDFTEAQQLLMDGHLRYTNNGDYIKQLNKKIAQESLKFK